jgi:deoxycitidine kinase
MATDLRVCNVTLIGNIGAGKSTFVDRIRAELKAKHPSLAATVHICPEPVEEWKAYGPDKINVLEEFYKDPERNALGFQMIAYTSRLIKYYGLLAKIQQQAPPGTDHVILSERCINSDRIFADTAITRPLDKLAYHTTHEAQCAISTVHATNILIYLKVDPTVCLDRIKRRERGEECKIEISYLEALDKRHDDYFKTCRVGTKNKILLKDNDIKAVRRVIKTIEEYDV